MLRSNSNTPDNKPKSQTVTATIKADSTDLAMLSPFLRRSHIRDTRNVSKIVLRFVFTQKKGGTK
jgi:hypothetical protein